MISRLQETVLVTEVTDVVVTPIVQDENSGLYLREIRVFGTPAETDANPPQVFVLRMESADPVQLAITLPVLEY